MAEPVEVKIRIDSRDLDELKKVSSKAASAPKSKDEKGDFLTSGITKLVAQIAIVTTILSAILKPMQGTLQILGLAFELFFRPFGLFLNSLLRPLAVYLLQFAILFNKSVAPALINLGRVLSTFTPGGGAAAATQIGTQAGQAISNAAVEVAKQAQPFIDSAIKGIGEFLGGIGEWLNVNLISPLAETITGWVSGFSEFVTNTAIPAVTGALQGISDTFDNLMKTFASKIKNFIDTVITPTWNTIRDAIVGIGPKLKSLIDEAVSKARSVISSLVSAIKAPAQAGANLIGSVVQAGKNLLGIKQTGGMIPATGLYQMHRGEQVISNTQQPQTSSVTIPISFGNVTINNGMDINKVADLIEARLRSNLSRKVTYGSGLI